MNEGCFKEDSYEQTLIQLFTEELGYDYECGYNVERDYRDAFHREDLSLALKRLNSLQRADVMAEAFRMITHMNEVLILNHYERTRAARNY